MDISAELSVYSQFMKVDDLLAKVQIPLALLTEEPEAIIPSLELAADGVALKGLLLVTKSYLGDVRVDQLPSHSEFDFVAKNTIVNYRLSMWTHEIKDGETVKESFEIGQVQLLHRRPQLATVISYAGKYRGEWLKRLTTAIPIQCLLYDI